MIGGKQREQVTNAIKSAGGLVTIAVVLSAVALIVAAAALIVAARRA